LFCAAVGVIGCAMGVAVVLELIVGRVSSELRGMAVCGGGMALLSGPLAIACGFSSLRKRAIQNEETPGKGAARSAVWLGSADLILGAVLLLAALVLL
jgi:hypothetical protein